VREITGHDENAINQTIEACKDGTGRYSLEQVISLLFDDSNVSCLASCSIDESIVFRMIQLRNNLQRSAHTSPNSSPSASNLPVPSTSVTAHPVYDRNNADTITDDVIEISPDIDHQSTADDELERFVRHE
jgi:hypothetical protein